MEPNGNWDWREFRAAMDEHISLHDQDAATLLDVLKQCDSIVGRIVDRPLSYSHQRPQDFVTAILSVRSFRLSVSAISVSLSGYSDSATNLIRTIWEIGLWLLLIQKDPIGASLGFLLSGVQQEIDMMQYDLEKATELGESVGKLPSNLQASQEYKSTLEIIIRAHGLSPADTMKKYKKLSPWQIAQEYGLERWYKRTYAFTSGFVHSFYRGRIDRFAAAKLRRGAPDVMRHGRSHLSLSCYSFVDELFAFLRTS